MRVPPRQLGPCAAHLLGAPVGAAGPRELLGGETGTRAPGSALRGVPGALGHFGEDRERLSPPCSELPEDERASWEHQGRPGHTPWGAA